MVGARLLIYLTLIFFLSFCQQSSFVIWLIIKKLIIIIIIIFYFTYSRLFSSSVTRWYVAFRWNTIWIVFLLIVHTKIRLFAVYIWNLKLKFNSILNLKNTFTLETLRTKYFISKQNCFNNIQNVFINEQLLQKYLFCEHFINKNC